MNDQKLAVESLAMDLKRVALGLYRGSYAMVNRFRDEALKRELELENQQPDSYLRKLLERTKQVLLDQNPDSAEDALMYSTLFQNYRLKRLK